MADLNVRILDIKESLFKSELSEFNKEELQGLNIEDRHSIRLDVDGDDSDLQNIIVRYKVTLSTNRNKALVELIELETASIFYVKDAKTFIKQEGDTIVKIDDQLMFVLLSTAIGSTRGMLSYKLASLPLNYVLPLIDLGKILSKEEES